MLHYTLCQMMSWKSAYSTYWGIVNCLPPLVCKTEILLARRNSQTALGFSINKISLTSFPVIFSLNQTVMETMTACDKSPLSI